MSSEIPGFESNLSHDKLFWVWLLGWIDLPHDVLFETKKKSGFAGIIKTEEDNFGVFIDESEWFEAGLEPVEDPHASKRSKFK